MKLIETDGFDVLDGISILCHYTTRTIEKDEQSKQYLIEISKHKKVVALPEKVTLFVNGDSIKVIGTRPFYYFENGLVIEKIDLNITFN